MLIYTSNYQIYQLSDRSFSELLWRVINVARWRWHVASKRWLVKASVAVFISVHLSILLQYIELHRQLLAHHDGERLQSIVTLF